MSTAILDAPATDSASPESPAKNLATCTEKLAALRFMIVLTARWENSDNIDKKRRQRMHADLARLRKLYSERIDEIAMSFGVQQAMDAKEDVERGVTVPRGIEPPAPAGVGEYDEENPGF